MKRSQNWLATASHPNTRTHTEDIFVENANEIERKNSTDEWKKEEEEEK